jgi:hypothetical protein
MSNERQVRETVARCVSIIVYYHNCGRAPKTTTAMIADVRAVADLVARLELGTDEIDELILRPVEAELRARYGHELGFRLNNEFVGAFEGTGSLSR